MKTDNKLDKAQSISYTKLALSFLLTVLKLLAGFFGNSTLLLADAVRSFSEFVNELVKLLDLFIANKPGDRSHNYGHGKIATLCLGAGACIFLFAGLNVFFQGSEQLLMFIQGREFETPKTIALFAAISAFVSRDIIFTDDYELQTREKPSKGRIYNKNSFVSGFIILGIGFTFLPGRILNITDSLAAVLVSLCLLWTSSRFLYRAADELIEASLDEDINRRIEEIIDKTDGVMSLKELKTRRIGKGMAINACIIVHYSMNIKKTAEITNLVEERLKAAFGENIYTLIRVEPSPLKNIMFQNDHALIKTDKNIT